MAEMFGAGMWALSHRPRNNEIIPCAFSQRPECAPVGDLPGVFQGNNEPRRSSSDDSDEQLSPSALPRLTACLSLSFHRANDDCSDAIAYHFQQESGKARKGNVHFVVNQHQESYSYSTILVSCHHKARKNTLDSFSALPTTLVVGNVTKAYMP